MTIPEDLQAIYNYYLDNVARGVEKLPIAPETVITLIERIAALEVDSTNYNSYLHDRCRLQINKEKETNSELSATVETLKNRLNDLQMNK